MKLASRMILVAAVAFVAALGGTAWGSAQRIGAKADEGVVLSGADIGFRMISRKGETPVGRLVVKVDGKWHEVEFATAVKPVSK